MSDTAMAERSQQSAPTESPAGAMMALIERAATSQDVDVDKLDKLLTMKERWDASQAKREFDEAMTQFRSSVGSIRKTRKAHNSSYAGLAETLSEIRDKLTESDLSVSWRTEQSDNLVRVTCVVSHVAGHAEQTTLAAAPDDSGKKNSIQAIGSTVTYLERYTLFAILGLASTDQDDDGASATRKPETITQQDADHLDALAAKVEGGKKRLENYLQQKFGSADPANIPANEYKHVLSIVEANIGGAK